MAHLQSSHCVFIMSVKNSVKWNAPQLSRHLTQAGRTNVESAERPDSGGRQGDGPVADSPRIATIGNRRNSMKRALEWLKPRRKTKSESPSSEKMGVRLPAFDRHMASARVLKAKTGELDERMAKKAFGDRVLPHHAELVRLDETMSLWSKASAFTDAVALPGQRVNPASLHSFLHRVDGELVALESAIHAQKRALAKTLPICTKDRAWLRALGRRLDTQRQHLQDTRQRMNAVLQGKGLSTADIQLYVDAGIPITPQTRDLAFTDDDFQRGSARPTEKGGVHSVEFLKARVTDPLTKEVTLVKKVFKGEPKNVQLPEAASATQIKQPVLSCRAVAASKVNDALGLSLIPKTEFALLDGQLGVAMDVVPGDALQRKGRAVLTVSEGVKTWAEQSHPDLQKFAQRKGFDGAEVEGDTIVFSRQTESLVLDERGDYKSVNGVPVKESAPADIQSSPDVLLDSPRNIAQLAAATCFNFLINSSDAHLGNCAFRPDGVLQYFDNDISFGRLSPDLDVALGGGVRAVHLTQLPEVIPTSLHDAVMAMTPDKLTAQLTGLLPTEEIKATCERFAALKRYCAHCAEFGKVLADDSPAWGQAEVQHDLGLDRIIAARGKLDLLEALEGDLARRNVPARYLLNLCVTEARTQACLRRERRWDSDLAVTFDPVVLHADLVQLSSPAAVSA